MTNRSVPASLPDNLSWHVAQLKPQGLARAQAHLDRQGFVHLAPRARDGRPLFPGYLFVAFDADQPGWQAVRSTRGIARLLGHSPTRPAPVHPVAMAALFDRLDAEARLLPPQDLQPGERVRVGSGPFVDWLAQVEDVPAADRIVLLARVMGREVRLTLAPDLLERG